jgi:Domain of unknown function (DUF2382)
MSRASGNATKSAFPMLDMMLHMQQLGLRAMTMYQPMVLTFLNLAERSTQLGFAGATRRTLDAHDANEEQVIAVGEEVLDVGTRMVPGKTTRVRRVVVQSPVQHDVTLHTETVVLERRQPLLSNGKDVLTEVTVEMSDFTEMPVVSKAVRLVEEVLLRKEVTARTETIHDTVKRDTIEIDQPSNLSVVFQAGLKPEENNPEGDPAGAQAASLILPARAEIQGRKPPQNNPEGDPAGGQTASLILPASAEIQGRKPPQNKPEGNSAGTQAASLLLPASAEIQGRKPPQNKPEGNPAGTQAASLILPADAKIQDRKSPQMVTKPGEHKRP